MNRVRLIASSRSSSSKSINGVRRPRGLAAVFAATAALSFGLAALPALAQEEAVPTTGSHIDPNARPVMLPTINAGGAIEAAKAVPIEANEARVNRPQIGEVDAAEWLPAETTPNK